MMLGLLRYLRPRGLFVGLVAPLALVACKVGDQDPPHCENELVASFHVTLRALDGDLPQNTRVFVKHGGGEETYELSAVAHHSQVVFCTSVVDRDAGSGSDSSADAGSDSGVADGAPDGDAGPGDAGDAGTKSAVAALDCELWTNGAATVDVEATGYAPLTRSLTAESNGCGGFRTVAAELVLAPAVDAGL